MHIDHDITHTPNHAVKCCNKDGSFPNTFDSNKCFPIEVPSDDKFWKGSSRCMDFARSLSSPSLKCEIDSRQQASFRNLKLDNQCFQFLPELSKYILFFIILKNTLYMVLSHEFKKQRLKVIFLIKS